MILSFITRTREAIVQPLADKCIGSARAGTRNKAQEILLLLVEADKPGPVIAELVPALKAKVPKTVSGAVSALRAILKTFGGNVVDAKQLLKALPTVFAHADKGVRAEGSLLALEIFRWFGLDVFETLVFKELKPVQVWCELSGLLSCVRSRRLIVTSTDPRCYSGQGA